MNLFNCFQAVAIYTATPFAIQWLHANGNTSWAIILGIGQLAGFVAMSAAINYATES